MQVKNISKNPILGIAVGTVGELPANRLNRIERYIELGMFEVIEDEKKEVKTTEEQPKKRTRTTKEK